MAVFQARDFDDHEQVVFCRDAASGLSAVIAVHDRTLGPATGGCRMWPYAAESEAVADALRLSRAMTYKNAVAGTALGGGKSVILGDPRAQKTPELLRAFGRCVEGLGGRYVVAEDVGISVADVETMAAETRWVAGTRDASGDPSPLTALGVLTGIRAAVRHALGRTDLDGLRVAVQGLGSVGARLCEGLAEAGASLVVADLHAETTRRVATRTGAEGVAPEAILEVEADVFAPCALGGVLDDRSIPRLRTPIVAGAANNQLAEPRHGESLRKAGILYAPDYVINAGGIINIDLEIAGCWSLEAARTRVERIGDRLGEIFRRADAAGVATSEVADELARETLRRARRNRSAPARPAQSRDESASGESQR